MAAKLLAKFELYPNLEAQKYLNQLGAHLAYHFGRPELKYHFALIKSNEINAFALPGGFIFVTTEAFKAAKNEQALTAILAHELAHIKFRHVVRALNLRSQSFLFGAASAISGASTQSFSLLLQKLMNQAEVILFQKGLEKDQELECDLFASEVLTNIGMNPSSFKSLLTTIGSNRAKIPTLGPTHPSFDTRIALIENFISLNKLKKDIESAPSKKYQDIVDMLN